MEPKTKDSLWMQCALALAKEAEAYDEVPVGALLVKEDQVIGTGYNRTIMDHDPTAHAEIIALRNAASNIGNYRLLETTLYVTLEPCCMCVGAMIHARVKRLVFGAFDAKTGAVNSQFQLLNLAAHNHQIEAQGGVGEHECSTLLSSFFRRLRAPKTD